MSEWEDSKTKQSLSYQATLLLREAGDPLPVTLETEDQIKARHRAKKRRKRRRKNK